MNDDGPCIRQLFGELRVRYQSVCPYSIQYQRTNPETHASSYELIHEACSNRIQISDVTRYARATRFGVTPEEDVVVPKMTPVITPQ